MPTTKQDLLFINSLPWILTDIPITTRLVPRHFYIPLVGYRNTPYNLIKWEFGINNNNPIQKRRFAIGDYYTMDGDGRKYKYQDITLLTNPYPSFTKPDKTIGLGEERRFDGDDLNNPYRVDSIAVETPGIYGATSYLKSDNSYYKSEDPKNFARVRDKFNIINRFVGRTLPTYKMIINPNDKYTRSEMDWTPKPSPILNKYKRK